MMEARLAQVQADSQATHFLEPIGDWFVTLGENIKGGFEDLGDAFESRWETSQEEKEQECLDNPDWVTC